MTTKHPRINVTLNPIDLEIIKILSDRDDISQAALIKKIVESYLEGYEDFLLAVRALEAEKDWEKRGRPTITHEELCRKLDIE